MMPTARPAGITKITMVPDLGRTPATVNRRTGELYISLKHWHQMPPPHRFFMLLHEMGHVALQTTDELAADRFAFEQYAGRGHSLKQSVHALSRQLSGRSPEHVERVRQQLNRALKYDKKHNRKNKKMAFVDTHGDYDVAVRQYDNTLDFPIWLIANESWGDLMSYNGAADLEVKKQIIKAQRRQREQIRARQKADARRRAYEKQQYRQRQQKLNRGRRALQAAGRAAAIGGRPQTPPPMYGQSRPRPRMAAPAWSFNASGANAGALGQPKGIFAIPRTIETW